MDTIFLHGITLEAIIGTQPAERIQKQPIIIDLDLRLNIQQAASLDALAHTVDYEKLYQRVVEFVAQSHFYLVEALAENLAELILDEFNVDQLRIRINKPRALPETPNVGIIIERKRR